MYRSFTSLPNIMLTALALGDGDGDDNSIDVNSPEFKQAVQEALEAQTEGLKAKQNELLGKIANYKEQLKKFDGLDADAVRQLMERFDSDEERALFEKGDVESIVNRRVDKMKSKFEADLTQAQQQLEKESGRRKELEGRAIAAEITQAAVEAGAIKTAVPDFIKRAQGNFALTEDNKVIAVDAEGNQLFDADGKTPLSAKAWADSLREEAPHLFNAPSGGGSQGGRSQSGVPAGNIGGSQKDREAYFAQKYNLPK